MRIAIITHVNHIQKDNQYFGYAPYVREMNIWLKYVDEVIIVAPLEKDRLTEIDSSYFYEKINFCEVPNFSFTSFRNNMESFFKLPLISWEIFCAMKSADHIHLRCPGNMGLIGSFIQVLFPFKIKTAKYAGNWDPKSKQPWTYRLQKWILNNTFLTRNMQVLVYGEWPNQSKNIKPFFTSSYSESEKEIIQKNSLYSSIEFLFVGSLVLGKNPLYAVKLIEELAKKGNNVILNLYGEGPERKKIENYIKDNQIGNNVILHGNQNQEIVKKAYKNSHFVILPSKSEGWPKAIAEGMFWGCVPLVTKVSCVPFMLDYGNRGIILDMDLKKDIENIEKILCDKNTFLAKSKLSIEWSQKYTTDVFEEEIKKLLIK
ncbi:glycosyltransferase family 4 protein [Flavobacterium gilvum]|uniref:Glycosyl transferase n=1 Tax=Flavobacterium gilvum TaxID=1492737 RepID=A0AAC9N5C3_9FLAO|nr:glycosyltransferase [Flavobacterium gilvum]AOW08114.1 glycosyl transferase [Flavobacterium gilvum]KFC58883.1 glycosyl transferase [Flavobacterium gilvum]